MKYHDRPERFATYESVPGLANNVLLALAAMFVATGCLGSGGRRGFQQSSIPVTPYAKTTTSAQHALSIAILPVLDQRPRDEGTDRAYRFSYRGKSYGFTDLRSLKRGLSGELSGHIAQALHRAGMFKKIILVDAASDAGSVDLVLSSQVARARGYVEQADTQKEKPRTEDKTLQLMSEFVLSDVRLSHTSSSAHMVFDSDFGWSIFEKREVEDEVAAAYTVLGEALTRTLRQLVLALASSDLSGRTRIIKNVQFTSKASLPGPFGLLAKQGPIGWKVAKLTETSSVPTGWQGSEVDCSSLILRSKQSWRFHRVLGPYQPSVKIWYCAASSALDYDMRADQSAEYLGRSSNGSHYFVKALGETNWKSCREDIVRHLNIIRPTKKYIFQLRPR